MHIQKKKFCSLFRAHYNLPSWLWQMLPSLLETIQTGKGRNGASTLASTLNLCKVGFNHLLIHTGFPHTFQSNFNREEKKEKYQNYCPNGSIICSDQLPVIWFWWKMPCREEFLQEDRIPVVTFWHSGKRNYDYSFLNGQVCGGVSIHSPSRVTLPLSLFQFLKDIWV